MGVELRDKEKYKVVINSLITSSNITFSEALDLLIDVTDIYDIENFIELIVNKLTDSEVE